MCPWFGEPPNQGILIKGNDGATAFRALLTKRTRNNKRVIANQSADWRGNPFSLKY